MVLLPSERPTHAGPATTQVFDTAHESDVKVKACAFYADCEHRLEPITAGHRLCLVGWWDGWLFSLLGWIFVYLTADLLGWSDGWMVVVRAWLDVFFFGR